MERTLGTSMFLMGMYGLGIVRRIFLTLSNRDHTWMIALRPFASQQHASLTGR